MILALLGVSALLLAAQTATATPTITISLYKNDGYGLGNDIGGVWTINAQTSADTVYVEFTLDGAPKLKDTSAPFSWQFDTADYSTGTHTLSATAYDSAGASATATMERTFQSKSTDDTMNMLLVGAAVIVVAALAIALYLKKR